MCSNVRSRHLKALESPFGTTEMPLCSLVGLGRLERQAGDIARAQRESRVPAGHREGCGERAPRRQAIIKKAAFLLCNVVIHPFVNGNKRVGFELVRLFLAANGFAFRGDGGSSYSFLVDSARASNEAGCQGRSAFHHG